MSLRHLIPAGGHAIDLLNGDIELRFATGDEEFVAFGTEDWSIPCRARWSSSRATPSSPAAGPGARATHTLTLPETTAIEFNVDGLPPVTRAEIEAACAEVAELIRRFCGGTSRIDYLTAETPRISLAP